MRLQTAMLIALCGALGCDYQKVAQEPPSSPFEADSPQVYVAKVKQLLTGLAPTDDEVAAVAADPGALKGLIDQWMTTPEYQQKMLTFFQLAFQQTQITTADFTEMIPPIGLGVGGQIPLLLQNIKESFARTVLAQIQAGRPITDGYTTHQLMMTPALMELYAFLDTRHVDDNAKISDSFFAAHPTLQLTVEASAGPIPIDQTLDPTNPNYMHWYVPQTGMLTNYPDQSCNTDPILLPADSYSLHVLLYGGVFNHKQPTTKVNCPTQSTTGYQMAASDFTTWKMITVRAPKAGESITTFFDLPSIRAANELVLKTPRPGFFSTPAFGANWPTNTSNQMRVTINQTLIVGTGAAIDGTDTTLPSSTPGLDAQHSSDGACLTCHQLLDPTRSILSSTWSWYYYPQTDPMLTGQKGLFAFQGVIQPVASIDEFASTLASHPLVPMAWAQKLCYWANSAACSPDDPEVKRIVAAFQADNLAWPTLVRELMSSPITTNTMQTATSQQNGEVVGVTRRDHLCAALANRLGVGDICGLDTQGKRAQTAVPQIVSGLPSDGYGRGATAPVLPNQPTLFYRAGLENICTAVAQMVVDGKANPNLPNLKIWSSSQPDAAIGDFVAIMMSLTSSDPRAAQANDILHQHFDDAKSSGASAADSLKSTFVAACLAPSFAGIGM